MLCTNLLVLPNAPISQHLGNSLYPYRTGTECNQIGSILPFVSGCTRFRAILTDGKALQLYSSALKCQPPHLTDQSSVGKILANLKSDIIAELLLKTSCASGMGILSVCLILHLYKLCHKMFEWKVFVSGIFANGAILFPWAKLFPFLLLRNFARKKSLNTFVSLCIFNVPVPSSVRF